MGDAALLGEAATLGFCTLEIALMPRSIDETHDPKLKSWVESANDPATDFPIQNLPFVAAWDKSDWYWPGVRIGDSVLNLWRLEEMGLLNCLKYHRPQGKTHFTSVMAEAGGKIAGEVRTAVSQLLNVSSTTPRKVVEQALHPVADLRLEFPGKPPNYTDFYASIHHATNVGSMFRPDNALLPNYKWVPIGYHGRASSVMPSGTEIRRPCGQTKADDAAEPRFGPCKLLDYELEVGFVVGRGNDLGSAIPLRDAEEHVLGICLVNDWSARDMQKWEYQPLGPFLAKSFATTVSPYIVTLEALAPFRCPVYQRPEGDPRPLPYLLDQSNETAGGIDLTLEVHISSADMRKRGMAPHRLSKGSFRDMYWTIAQMVAHHSSNGCNLQPGDLMASGTVSGPTAGSRGCMLELTWGGAGQPRAPIELPTGEKRVFLEDGDEVILRGYCEREGFRRIGLGECRGVITPAIREGTT